MLAALVLLSTCLSRPALAWDRHQQLTRVALAGLAELDAQAPAETLQSYLTATGIAATERDFLVHNKMSFVTTFGFYAGESAGAPVSLRRVIEEYADEPDWAMDQELFDQYPDLWQDDYLYMGGRNGPQTRAFRHMYWPMGFLRAPTPPGKTPIHDPKILGEAPERAELFFKMSQQAFKSGHPYWGARFLAWSLHYLQDLTMPFHAAQLPSTDMLRWKPDGSLDLEQTVRVVIYYHLAIDAYPSRASSGGLGTAAGGLIDAALGGAVPAGAFPGARGLAEQAAMSSSQGARGIAEAAADFLPAAGAAAVADPMGTVSGQAFWDQITQNQTAHPADMDAFVSALESLLRTTADDTRSYVAEALKSVPKPAVSPAPPVIIGPVLGGVTAVLRRGFDGAGVK
jgi:hypothetical protein